MHHKGRINLQSLAGLPIQCRVYSRGSKGHRLTLIKFTNPLDGTLRVGWSLCRSTDSFDLQTGVNIATARAAKHDCLLEHVHRIPKSVLRVMWEFISEDLSTAPIINGISDNISQSDEAEGEPEILNTPPTADAPWIEKAGEAWLS